MMQCTQGHRDSFKFTMKRQLHKITYIVYSIYLNITNYFSTKHHFHPLWNRQEQCNSYSLPCFPSQTFPFLLYLMYLTKTKKYGPQTYYKETDDITKLVRRAVVLPLSPNDKLNCCCLIAYSKYNKTKISCITGATKSYEFTHQTIHIF